MYPWQHMYIWVKKIRGDIRKLIYLRYTVCKISWVYKHMWQPIDTPHNATKSILRHIPTHNTTEYTHDALCGRNRGIDYGCRV